MCVLFARAVADMPNMPLDYASDAEYQAFRSCVGGAEHSEGNRNFGRKTPFEGDRKKEKVMAESAELTVLIISFDYHSRSLGRKVPVWNGPLLKIPFGGKGLNRTILV